jgi:transposase-like protein
MVELLLQGKSLTKTHLGSCPVLPGQIKQQGRLAGLTKLRSSKYLHNLVEQDHRNTKSRFSAMLA